MSEKEEQATPSASEHTGKPEDEMSCCAQMREMMAKMAKMAGAYGSCAEMPGPASTQSGAGPRTCC